MENLGSHQCDLTKLLKQTYDPTMVERTGEVRRRPFIFDRLPYWVNEYGARVYSAELYLRRLAEWEEEEAIKLSRSLKAINNRISSPRQDIFEGKIRITI